MPRYEPPVKWMRLTASIDSGWAQPVLPCISHLKPSRTPTTPMPLTSARMVAALITLLIPRVRVADPAFNAAHTVALMEQAAAQRAVLLLFPELGLSAYSCDDLFHQR